MVLKACLYVLMQSHPNWSFIHTCWRVSLTLLLLKRCPQQVGGWLLGQMDGTRLLVDMSHTVSAVAL